MQSQTVDIRDIIWLVLFSLSLVLLLLPFASYVAAISFIQDEWRLNNTQAGAVYSAYLAGYVGSALIVIPLTDRLGSKYIFIGSAVISVVSHVLFSQVAQGMGSGAVLLAIAGVGLVGIYMPGLRVISERIPTQGRGMAIGLFVTAYYTAYSASLAASGGLMAWLEWRETYLILALASASGLPLAYLLLRNHDHVPDQRSSGRLDLAVLKNPVARLYILSYSLHAFELYAVRVWLPAFLTAALVAKGRDYADAVVAGATVAGLVLAAGAVGPIVGGIISDRLGRAASAAGIFALSGACSWAIGWVGGLPWPVIVGLGVVYGWAIAADSAIYSTAITEAAKPAQLGSTMAVQAFLGFMGGLVGPIAVGGILDMTSESFRWGFSFVGLLSIIAIVALLRVRSLTGRQELHPVNTYFVPAPPP